jgi:uncharacterized protein YfaS (alpha-2-macroglobulin family)
MYVLTEGATLAYTGDWLKVLPAKKKYFPGETARILITAPYKDTHVLVSSEGHLLYDYKVVAAKGNARVVELPIKESYAPNFYFTIALVKENALLTAQRMIIVPPREKFLSVKIKPDKDSYQPQQSGLLTVKATDSEGHPVSAELSIGVVDESLYNIRSEMTVPAAEYFYHLKRNNVTTGSGILNNSYGYAKVTKRLPAPVRHSKPLEKGGISDIGRSMGTTPGEPESSAPLSAPPRRRGGEGPRLSLSDEDDEDVSCDDECDEEPDFPAPRLALRDWGATRSAGKKIAAGRVKKPPVARKEFKTTILWLAHIVTDKNGEARVTVKYPDNLTRWRTTVRAFTRDTRVAEAFAETRTTKNIVTRVALPRFMRERDVLKTKTITHNQLATDVNARMSLETSGVKVTGSDLEVVIKAKGHVVNEYTLTAEVPGEALFRAQALTKDASDLLERRIAILPHGVEKALSVTGTITAAGETREITLPAETDLRTAYLRVYITGTIEDAVSQALPYINSYPHWCTEQTLEKFAPDIAAMEAFSKIGIQHPIHEKLKKMVEKGFSVLTANQHQDGGWGWWANDKSNPHMSALVLCALAEAKGFPGGEGMLKRGAKYLLKELGSKGEGLDYETRALGVYALALAKAKGADKLADAVLESAKKKGSSAHARAFLALAYHVLGRGTEAKVLAAELEKEAKKAGGGVCWGAGGNGRWQNDEIEATAEVMHALVLIKPESEYITGAITFLMDKRRGNHWRGTQDTAAVVRAFSKYLIHAGAGKAAVKVSAILNGKEKTIELKAGESKIDKLVLAFSGDELKAGKNTLVLKKDGKEVYHFSAYARYVTTEENVTPSSSGLEVSRKYTVRSSKSIHPSKASVGTFLVVTLFVKTDKAREYVMITDYLPSSAQVLHEREQKDFLSRDVRGRYDHWERHAEKTVFFVTNLPAGETRISYVFRMTHAGTFHTMPAEAELMYFPDVRGSSAEYIFNVAAARARKGAGREDNEPARRLDERAYYRRQGHGQRREYNTAYARC